MSELFDSLIHIIDLVFEKSGYLGVIFGSFIDSTFIPLPSEVVMIPAGIAASSGKMNIYLVILSATFGCTLGALFNYFLGYYFGRAFVIRFGKYFFIKEESLEKIDQFFYKHGSISTFTGRLLPGIRHYISISAGIAKMNLFKFNLYTSLGSGIWMAILGFIGYTIGNNRAKISEYIHIAFIGSICVCAVIIAAYFIIKKVSAKSNSIKKI